MTKFIQVDDNAWVNLEQVRSIKLVNLHNQETPCEIHFDTGDTTYTKTMKLSLEGTRSYIQHIIQL